MEIRTLLQLRNKAVKYVFAIIHLLMFMKTNWNIKDLCNCYGLKENILKYTAVLNIHVM